MGRLKGCGPCDLAFGDNRARRCAWDGKPLRGRARRWCSDRCQWAYYWNHVWSHARQHRLETDGYQCVRCGRPASMGSPIPSGGLEVHHKVPLQGRDRGATCYNHQDNLETLCKTCHNTETVAQREAGALIRQKRTRKV